MGNGKLHLVNWDNVCKQKHYSGLGLCFLDENNVAFLMKVC